MYYSIFRRTGWQLPHIYTQRRNVLKIDFWPLARLLPRFWLTSETMNTIIISVVLTTIPDVTLYGNTRGCNVFICACADDPLAVYAQRSGSVFVKLIRERSAVAQWVTGVTDFVVVSMTARSVSRRNLFYAVQFATVTALHSFPGLLSWFIPCYQFGKNAEAVGESCCLCGFLLCFLYWWGGPLWTSILRCTIRGKIRQQKGIDVSDDKPGLDLAVIVRGYYM